MKSRIIILLILGLASSRSFAFESANSVLNPSFTEIYESGMPADWGNISHPNYLAQIGTRLVVSPENFLQDTRESKQTANLGEQRVLLAPEVRQVGISLRVRAPYFVIGDVDWQVPGLSYSWLLADNTERPIGPGSWLLLKYPTQEWTKLDTLIAKPADAIAIKISILGIGWIGQADFDDVRVEPIP
jgi:hypothetical protein